MIAAGFPVTAGANWSSTDAASYKKWVASESYKAGIPHKEHLYNYGLAYASLMPAQVNTDAQPYAATLAHTPSSGAHTQAITFQLTETYGAGASFSWAFGDGNTATTTTNHTTHTYSAAGTYTCTVTPTVNGIAQTPVSATALTLT